MPSLKMQGTFPQDFRHQCFPLQAGFPTEYSLLPSTSILKLDPLPPTNVNRPAFVAPPLLLILLLREALPLRHAQILMRPVRVVVRAVRIRRHLGVDAGVFRDALEGRVLLLRELGGVGRGRG